MDALRRAEADDTPESTAPESSAVEETPLPEADSSSLQLEPLEADRALDDAPTGTVAPEVANSTGAASAADTATVNDSPAQKQAQRVINSMSGKQPWAGKQALFVFTGFATAAFVLAAYYLWKSNQMIAPRIPQGGTLVTAPQVTVVEAVSETASAIVAEPARQVVQADQDKHTEPSFQESSPGVSVLSAADSDKTVPATEVENPGHRIKIHKRRIARTVPPQLKQAYQAYQNRDYRQAQELYRQALRRYPENRDAMLGLAAIALHQGNRRVAHYYYSQLLKSHPADKTALLALQSLQGEHGQLEYGSQIKHWLQSDKGNAPMHFALGNQHAANGRWKEAQQAYFEAHRLQPDNADYAFNVAVSLDQLSLPRQALDYYLLAQKLAASSASQFGSGQLERRITQLRGQTGQDS